MKILKKLPGCDFRVLNLTDPQLADGEWDEGRKEKTILEHTVRELVRRTEPDLITVSGDLAWAGHERSYRKLKDLLESFSIPWAPVFGNHDVQGGREQLLRAAAILKSGEHCLFEQGEEALGCGNYVIGVEEHGRLVHGLILMDTHDRREYTKDGKSTLEWADLLPAQFEWYQDQVSALAAAGSKESTLIIHIPLYTYREAAKAAFREGVDPRALPPDVGPESGVYAPGYEDSFGTMYEGICSYPEDNGFFDLLKALDHTKTVLCGHDHIDNFAVTYRGVRLVYALKTGPGCYYDPRMNGGTLLSISSSGTLKCSHVYVAPPEM